MSSTVNVKLDLATADTQVAIEDADEFRVSERSNDGTLALKKTIASGVRERPVDREPEDGSLALQETIASGVREPRAAKGDSEDDSLALQKTIASGAHQPPTDDGFDPLLQKRVLAGLFPGRHNERETIDRFPILGKLGAGGMGVVYAGYDEELDRKIAIKLVRSQSAVVQDMEAKRLLREAQAMAKLDHPNVVRVYQAGLSEGRTFIAMEFVRGQTLAEWLTEEARSWREVVEVFVQAGRGLAAAHAAGIIHRDFKPANAMIDELGVIKVLDFGLAGTSHCEGDAHGARSGPGSSFNERLTRTGALMGTPAYMAPEQIEAREVDARSDQFSFCVALYEGLYGQHPFPVDSFAKLIEAVREGLLKPPPRDKAIPPWVHQIVVRGLATDPNQRHPSMTALLDALERDPVALRRRRLGISSAFVGIGLLGVALAPLVNPTSANSASAPTCEEADSTIDGIWDPTRRETIGTALTDTGVDYAAEVWERVAPQLDTYVEDWADMRREACETHRAAEQSDTLFDQRNACLDRRLAGLQTLLASLEQADAKMVDKLPMAVAGLPPIPFCGDIQALMADIRPPENPTVAAEVERLREQVARAQSLEGLGQYDAGLKLIETVVERAEELGYAPLEAEALLQRGYLQQPSKKTEETMASLRDAELRAIAGDHPEVAAAALSRAMIFRGMRAFEPERAMEDAPRIEAFLERVPHAQGLRGVFLNDLADLWRREGELERAIEGFEASLAVKREAFGERHLQVAFTLANESLAHALLGDYPRANKLLDESIAIRIETVGPRHAVTLRAVGRRADFTLDLGCHAEARPLVEQSLARMDETDAMSSELALNSLSAAARLELETRNLSRAREYIERGLAIARALHSPIDEALQLQRLAAVELPSGAVEHALELYERALTLANEAGDGPFASYSLLVFGDGLREAGQLERSRAYIERALASFEALGAESEIRAALMSLGRTQARAGQLVEAQASLERALALRGQARQDNAQIDIDRARVEVELARVLLERGLAEEAKTTFERALGTLGGCCQSETLELAMIRFDLARALLDLEVPEREKAAQLAAQAAATLAELGSAFAQEAQRVDTWRRDQGLN